MAKIDKDTKNRIEGLRWALRIIEEEENAEKGVDMLRREIRFRNIIPAPMNSTAKDVRTANEMLTRRLISALLVVMIKILDDEYGWKKKRLKSFIEHFHRHTVGFEDIDPYGDHYAELSDYAKYFNENYDAGFSVEAIDEMIQVEKENKMRALRYVQFDVIEKHLKNSYPEALEHLKKTLEI